MIFGTQVARNLSAWKRPPFAPFWQRGVSCPSAQVSGADPGIVQRTAGCLEIGREWLQRDDVRIAVGPVPDDALEVDERVVPGSVAVISRPGDVGLVNGANLGCPQAGPCAVGVVPSRLGLAPICCM